MGNLDLFPSQKAPRIERYVSVVFSVERCNHTLVKRDRSPRDMRKSLSFTNTRWIRGRRTDGHQREEGGKAREIHIKISWCDWKNGRAGLCGEDSSWGVVVVPKNLNVRQGM